MYKDYVGMHEVHRQMNDYILITLIFFFKCLVTNQSRDENLLGVGKTILDHVLNQIPFLLKTNKIHNANDSKKCVFMVFKNYF